MKRILSFLGLILSLSLLLSACGQTTDTDGLPNKIIIKIQEFGEIYAELYPEEAPITVANFKKLVNEHYYDGLRKGHRRYGSGGQDCLSGNRFFRCASHSGDY